MRGRGVGPVRGGAAEGGRDGRAGVLPWWTGECERRRGPGRDPRAGGGRLGGRGARHHLWEETLRLPQWAGAPVWVHADLLPGNLLTTAGRLTAVIDFGGLGVGDPACDLLPAWTLFTGASRTAFRDTADVDDATWARGRGWALCFGIVAEHYYRDKGHVLAEVGRRAVGEVLAEYA